MQEHGSKRCYWKSSYDISQYVHCLSCYSYMLLCVEDVRTGANILYIAWQSRGTCHHEEDKQQRSFAINVISANKSLHCYKLLMSPLVLLLQLLLLLRRDTTAEHAAKPMVTWWVDGADQATCEMMTRAKLTCAWYRLNVRALCRGINTFSRNCRCSAFSGKANPLIMLQHAQKQNMKFSAA